MADLRRQTHQNLVYFSSPQLALFRPLRHAFFTRLGGVSTGMFESLNFRKNNGDLPERVGRNFEIATALLGAAPHQVAHTVQRHTDIIRVVRSAGQPDPNGPADALITAVPGICLTGFYADCQLLLFYDQRKKVAAVAHCGWRGLMQELPGKTVARMTAEFGCRPADLTVAVGPSICRRCFETDRDVPDLLLGVYGDMIRDYIYPEGAKWHVDLKNITYAALLRCGVPPLNIDISNQCTRCGSEQLFWSHRRHGEDRGVHAGMIVML